MTFFKNCLFLVKHASRLTSLNRKLESQARLASSTQLNSVQLSSTQFESAQLSSIQLDSALNFQTCFVLFFLILNFSNYQPGNLASFLNFECSLREATYCWNPFEIFFSKQQNLYIFVYLWYSRMYLLFWRVKNHWWFNNCYIFFRVCVIKIYLVPG